jgi:hypothetical protein
VFSLNISDLSLPEIEDEDIIEAYETALAYELPEKGFGVHTIIDFLEKYPAFAIHGFYRGFSSLIYNTILCDSRVHSEFWLISVLLKITSLNIKDPNTLKCFDKLVDENFERIVNNAPAKFLVLQSFRDALSPK